MKKIAVKWIRELNLITSKGTFGISAASGLVKIGSFLHVIADDELFLGIFSLGTQRSEFVLPLIFGNLPEDPIERKKIKPDWEALVRIESVNKSTEGLLVIPSGAKPNRQEGVFVNLENLKNPEKSNLILTVDFSAVYEVLRKTISNLNIEGACFSENLFKLFQRGNAKNGQNAIIELDGAGILHDILHGGLLQAHRILTIKNYDLGMLNDCRLSFTDACSLNDNEVWFLAAAEKTDSTYDDGEFHGAILGCINRNGTYVERYELDCPTKPEGLWVEQESDGIQIYIVTDADNSKMPASLYSTKISSDERL